MIENRGACERRTLSDKCGTYLTWSMQLFWIPIVQTPTKTKIMHSAKKQAMLILHIYAIILLRRPGVANQWRIG